MSFQSWSLPLGVTSRIHQKFLKACFFFCLFVFILEGLSLDIAKGSILAVSGLAHMWPMWRPAAHPLWVPYILLTGKLWDIYTIKGITRYITIQLWIINDVKFKVVSLITHFCDNKTIYYREMEIKKRDNSIRTVSSRGYIEGTMWAKNGLWILRISSRYRDVSCINNIVLIVRR